MGKVPTSYSSSSNCPGSLMVSGYATLARSLRLSSSNSFPAFGFSKKSMLTMIGSPSAVESKSCTPTSWKSQMQPYPQLRTVFVWKSLRSHSTDSFAGQKYEAARCRRLIRMNYAFSQKPICLSFSNACLTWCLTLLRFCNLNLKIKPNDFPSIKSFQTIAQQTYKTLKVYTHPQRQANGLPGILSCGPEDEVSKLPLLQYIRRRLAKADILEERMLDCPREDPILGPAPCHCPLALSQIR